MKYSQCIKWEKISVPNSMPFVFYYVHLCAQKVLEVQSKDQLLIISTSKEPVKCKCRITGGGPTNLCFRVY